MGQDVSRSNDVFGHRYTRRSLIRHLEHDPELQAAIKREGPPKHWWSKYRSPLRRYLSEMVPSPSSRFARFALALSRRLLGRIFTNIDIQGLENLPEPEPNESLVYLPSHRSHLDQILLFDMLYQAGRRLPHTMAGNNLNIPFFGGVLRWLGGIYIRRVFKGQALYSLTFRRFLFYLLREQVPLMFYIEGTRSRNGKSLPPKPGMFSMLMTYLQENPDRDLKIVPMALAYEKLIEESSFIKELGGLPKRKETVNGLIKSRHALGLSYGTAFVTVGTPMSLRTLMDSYLASKALDAFPNNLQPAAYDLGMEVIEQINSNTRTSAVPLVAMALLSENRQGFRKQELIRKAQFLFDLHTAMHPDSAGALVLTHKNLEKTVEFMFEQGAVGKHPDSEGTVYFFKYQDKIRLNLYKNNLLHQFVIPSLAATLLLKGPQTRESLLSSILLFDHLCRYEFVFPRDYDFRSELEAFLQHALESSLLSERDGLLELTRHDHQEVVMLSRLLLPFREAFFIAERTLMRTRLTFPVDKHDLVGKMQLSATALILLGTIESPEANTTDTFKNILRFLIEEGYLIEQSESSPNSTQVILDDKAEELAEIVQWLLPEELDQTA